MRISRCAFCAQPRAITQEDIFAKWMRSVIPRTGRETHTRTIYRPVLRNDGTYAPLAARYRKQGHAASLKVACACKGCNGGWMSGLETRNRPLLTTLIQGGTCVVSEEEIRNLSAWVAKTVMAAEFYRKESVAIPQADRTWLRENLVPPIQGWNIWLTAFEGPIWAAGMRHESLNMPIPRPDGMFERPFEINTQLTAMKLGFLAIVAISTTTPNPFTIGDERTGDFRRIWPTPPGLFIWNPLRRLDEPAVDRVLDTFSTATGSRQAWSR